MRTWRTAWAEANLRFYRAQAPDDHFRTSTAYVDVLAASIAAMAVARLPGPMSLPGTDVLDVIDIGAASAGLGRHVAGLLDEAGWRTRVRTYDIRPADGVTVGVAPDVVFADPPAHGLLIAHEWLDDIACERIIIDARGEPHLLLDDDGIAVTGPNLHDPACAQWDVDSQALHDWWSTWAPCRIPGTVVDIGTARDDAWTNLVGHLQAGLALAVDYPVSRTHRCAIGTTVTAYRRGRRVPVALDGSVNVTAHVAFDSLALAGARRARTTSLHRQRECIVPPGAAPHPLSQLALTGRMSALRDPVGLGAFRWLLHTK